VYQPRALLNHHHIMESSRISATFSRDSLPSPGDPKSIAEANLHQALSMYYALQASDSRGVSPQYRAYEATFAIARNDGTAPKEEGQDAVKLIQAHREKSLFGYQIPFPNDAQIEAVTLNGVSCYWISFQGQHSWKSGPFMVGCHGGCFLYCGIKTHAGLYAEISRSFDVPILFIDYRLAPEAQFPAQREDVLNVHKALIAEDPLCPQRLCVYGESAGGNLSLSYVQAALAAGLPPPKACIALSPYVDMECKGKSYTENAKTDIWMSPAQTAWWWRQCSWAIPAHETEMNIFRGSFTGFPPTYIWAGGAELLLSDAERVAQALEAAKCDVTLHVQPYMPHNHAQYTKFSPEAQEATAQMRVWLRKKMSL